MYKQRYSTSHYMVYGFGNRGWGFRMGKMEKLVFQVFVETQNVLKLFKINTKCSLKIAKFKQYKI